MTLNLEQIKEIIPHRDPFLLIDEVTELEPGVSVTAKKYLKPDEYWFKGHFPGKQGQDRVLRSYRQGEIPWDGSSRRHPGASRHNDKEEGSDRLR